MYISKIFYPLCLFLLFMSGCRVGPTYQPPALNAPTEWKGAHPFPDTEPCIDYWWEVFNDEDLNCLEQEAVKNNPNLYIALERVFQAKATATAQGAARFPQLNMNPAYSDYGQLFQFHVPQGIPIPISTTPFRIVQAQYLLPLNLNYEVDLWGKVQGQYDSALMSAEAQQEAYYSALLSLTSEVAMHYFQMRAWDSDLKVLKKTVEEYQKEENLVNDRFTKGLVNKLDLVNASLQLTNAKADYEDSSRQRILEENAIAALLGIFASEFSMPFNPLEGPPPVIPAGIPSEILLQRPDIAQAERNLAAEQALIGVAYASFLPSLNLTGTLGYSSPDLKQFLTWQSRYWAMGANMGQNIFDGGTNLANLAIAYANFHEAGGAYQQQVLTAFREVEDALNNLEKQKIQADYIKSSLESSRESYSMSQKRYLNGLVNYLEVFVYQQTTLNTERNYVRLQGVQYLSTVQLIKALGGVWGCMEE